MNKHITQEDLIKAQSREKPRQEVVAQAREESIQVNLPNEQQDKYAHIVARVYDMLVSLRRERPMVHMIPNDVSATLCADAIAATGARPIMAIAKEEVMDIVAQSGSLVINAGQLTTIKQESMRQAVKGAISHKKQVVFDPVGAGASLFRLQYAKEIEAMDWEGIIKLNTSEYKALISQELTYTGVDGMGKVEHAKANTLGKRAVCITGAIDHIWTGEKWIGIGHEATRLPQIVGSGCLLGALCGAFLTVTDKPYEAGVAASLLCAVASIEAEAQAVGYGDYKVKLIDALSTITHESLHKYGIALLEKGEEYGTNI